MSKLSWIDDDLFEPIVLSTLHRAAEAYEEAPRRIQKNVIDPFSSLVMAATADIQESKSILDAQKIASLSSGISSAIGNFHQQVLGQVKGFVNHDSGYDLECPASKILAEVKNKHNTMNSTNREKVISDLDTAVKQKSGNWTAYLVIIIPRKPKRYHCKLTNREVYEIDGASFYELATGSETALHDLYYAAKDVITEKHPGLNSGSMLDYCRDALLKAVPK